jgi:hypothetical protein
MFYSDLHENPAASLDSVYRLLHNPQVLSERLFAESSAQLIQRLDIDMRDDGNTQNEFTTVIESLARETLGVSYSQSKSRIAEESIATIEKVQNIAGRHSLPVDRLLQLKGDLASERLSGQDQITDAVVSKYTEIFNSVSKEMIRDLLFSPDIDDCKANLQLGRTATEHPQEQYLSDIFLSRLEDYVIDPEPVEQRQEALQSRHRYWGRVDDDQLIFLRW